MNAFEEMIQELGKELNIPLHAERNRLCKLNINDVMHVQMEFDEPKERILIACFTSELPPGKFRENVLKEALKANNQFPIFAILAYSEKNNKLALFKHLPIASLTPVLLSEELMKFIEKADQWRVAVETGQLGALSSATPGKEKPPFGLKS